MPVVKLATEARLFCAARLMSTDILAFSCGAFPSDGSHPCAPLGLATDILILRLDLSIALGMHSPILKLYTRFVHTHLARAWPK